MSSKQAASSAFSFERINRAPTNQSTTKQTFSFSKSSRFYEPKPECPQASYGGDYHNQKKHRGTAIGFGQRYDFTKCLNSSPSSNRYRIKTFWEENADNQKGIKFAFSRDKVQFSNYVSKEISAVPPPTAYEINQKATRKSAPKFTVRQKTTIPDKKLTIQPQNNNPGPGAYDNQTLLKQSSVGTFSKFQNIMYSQPRSKRFFTSQTVSPGPGKYDDLLTISKTGNHILSHLKGAIKGKFDQQKKQSIFQKINSKLIPGPGAYQYPSEFGHYDAQFYEEIKAKKKRKEGDINKEKMLK